jgi:hypothetical protein
MDYLTNFFSTLTNNQAFILAVLLGMLGHYAKKRAKKETKVSLKEWFGNFNIYGTISSIITSLIAVVGVVANNLITDDMSLATAIYIGLTSGFAIDSATNSDGVVEQTEPEPTSNREIIAESLHDLIDHNLKSKNKAH